MDDVKCFDIGRFPLQSDKLTPDGFYLAYRTFGALNAAADNVILYCTSLGSTHETAKLNIGPGMVLDPALCVSPNPKLSLCFGVF